MSLNKTFTGAISNIGGGTATVFAGILDNGAAENNRANLNFISGTFMSVVITDDAANDELEIGITMDWASFLAATDSTSIVLGSNTYQRAALTGDVTAAQNSNVTTIANDAVTTVKILNDAVTTAKILDSAVTIPKLDIDELEVSTTGTIDDQAKTDTVGVIMFSGTSAVTLQSVESTNHSRGVPLTIHKQNASTLDISDNAGTTSTYRFATYRDKTIRLLDDEGAYFIPVDITSGGTDSKRWMCVSHRWPFHNSPDNQIGDVICHNGTDWDVYQDSHFTTATSTVVSNSNVETTAVNLTIPASSLVVGATYEMVMHGGTNRGATLTAANLTIRLKTGGVTSAAFAAQAVQTTSGINLVTVRSMWKCSAVGAGGVIDTNAELTSELGTRAADCVSLLSRASGSFATTIAQVIGVSVQFSAAVTNLSFEVYSAYIRRVI